MSQTSPQSSDPRSLIRYACVALAITVVTLWTLYLVRGPLLTIYVSALFATGLAPLVQTIERQRIRVISHKRLPRPAAILVIYAAVIGALAALVAAVVPPMIEQLEQFWQQLPTYIEQAQLKLASWGRIAPEASVQEIVKQAPSGSGNIVGVVLSTAWGFVGGLFGLVSILLLTFYFLVESSDIFDLFVRLFPAEHRARVHEVSARVGDKISAWLGGQLLLGLIIGSMSALGFFVLGVIAGIGEMIPMVGPLLSAVPAVGVALTVSPGLALGVAGYCLALQMVENNVLVPKVMGQTVGLSAVTVIVALAIGSELLGFVGALLAVPTAAIVQVLVEELYLSEKASA
jgi:predicted PurR-regulated permease PerM